MENKELLQSENTEMRREIGLFGGISVLAGIMIGSGIFYLGAIVLVRSGMSLGLSLLVWAAGGIVVLLSGLCYAELGAMMPRAGGGYVYLREAYGEGVAFMSGFSGFVLASSGSIAALAVALPAAAAAFFPISVLAQKLIAVLLILLLTGINILGVRISSRFQGLLFIIKMLPIAAIIICGLVMGTQTPSLSINPSGASFSEILGMLAFGIVATLWAYEGWTNLNTVSEEIKNPKKNLPLAIILSIVGVMVIYVIFNYAVYRVLPVDTIASLIASGDYYLGTAAAGRLFGGFGGLLVGAAMATAVLNSLNGCIMVFPRAYYAMAIDGAFFKSAARLHPKYKTPVGALLLSAGVSIALVFTRSLSQLTGLVAFSGLIFNSLVFLAVIILRKKYPDLKRPYKVVGYPVVVIIVILIMMALLINTLVTDTVNSLVGLSVPVVGLIIYLIFFRKKTGKAE